MFEGLYVIYLGFNEGTAVLEFETFDPLTETWEMVPLPESQFPPFAYFFDFTYWNEGGFWTCTGFQETFEYWYSYDFENWTFGTEQEAEDMPLLDKEFARWIGQDFGTFVCGFLGDTGDGFGYTTSLTGIGPPGDPMVIEDPGDRPDPGDPDYDEWIPTDFADDSSSFVGHWDWDPTTNTMMAFTEHWDVDEYPKGAGQFVDLDDGPVWTDDGGVGTEGWYGYEGSPPTVDAVVWDRETDPAPAEAETVWGFTVAGVQYVGHVFNFPWVASGRTMTTNDLLIIFMHGPLDASTGGVILNPEQVFPSGPDSWYNGHVFSDHTTGWIAHQEFTDNGIVGYIDTSTSDPVFANFTTPWGDEQMSPYYAAVSHVHPDRSGFKWNNDDGHLTLLTGPVISDDMGTFMPGSSTYVRTDIVDNFNQLNYVSGLIEPPEPEGPWIRRRQRDDVSRKKINAPTSRIASSRRGRMNVYDQVA